MVSETERRSRIEQTGCWLLPALGAALRLGAFLANRNLWLDEATLAMNIVHRGFGGLLRPLEYGQMAPIGFLWVTKLSAVALGDGEMPLRLPAQIAALAALWLFAKLARETMPGLGGMAALALFACNPELVGYAAQAKPYAFDALAATGLLLLGWRVMAGRSDARGYALAAVAAPWFSFTSCFVVGGIGLALCAAKARARDWRGVVPVAAATGAAAASYLAQYVFFCRSAAAAMRGMAMHQSARLRLGSVADLRVDARLLLETMVAPGGYTRAGLGMAVMGIGLMILWRGGKAKLGLLLTAVGVVGLAASWLGRYPLESRLILFLVPIFCLAAGAALGWRPWAMVVGIVVLAPMGWQSVRLARRAQGFTSVMDGIANRAEGATVLIDDYSTPVFRYYNRWGEYSRRLKIAGGEYYLEDETPRMDVTAYGKVWIVFPDYYIGAAEGHAQQVLAALAKTGRRADAIEETTSRAYLFEK